MNLKTKSINFLLILRGAKLNFLGLSSFDTSIHQKSAFLKYLSHGLAKFFNNLLIFAISINSTKEIEDEWTKEGLYKPKL